MSAIIPFLKKLGKLALKKIASSASKGLKSLINNQVISNFRGKQGKKNTESRKKPNLLVIVLAVIVALISMAGAGIGLVIGLFCLPVLLVSYVLQAVMAPGNAMTAIINEYWDTYASEYGTEQQISSVSESDKLEFLLGYDDFWNEIEPYFELDRDTMTNICAAVTDGEVVEVGQVTSEVHIYDLSGQYLYAASQSELAYDSATPVYYETQYNLTWQQLYAFVCGVSDGGSVDDETVTSIAEGLSPVLETEYTPPDTVYRWSELLDMDCIQEENLPISESVYQNSDNSEVIVRNSEEYSKDSVCYTRRCPVMVPESSVSVWCGTLEYDAEGSASFTQSSETIDSVMEELKLELDADKTISSVMSMPNGYATAKEISEVISDGTISISGNTAFDSVFEVLGGDNALLSQILRLFGLTGNDSGSLAGSFDDEAVNALIEEGEKYIGMAYVWGGSSPATGFDCSGFVCWVYTNSGVYNLPRTTAQELYNQCTEVSYEDAKPGDLVFFTKTFDGAVNTVSHVGIYVGDDTMLHAGDPIGYTDLNLKFWQDHLYAYGRLPEQEDE